MSAECTTLTSPCGYYGLMALQEVKSPLARLAIRSDRVCGPGPRSHFDGLRLVRNGAQWQLEGRTGSFVHPDYGEFWLPCASLTAPTSSTPPSNSWANNLKLKTEAIEEMIPELVAKLPPELHEAAAAANESAERLRDVERRSRGTLARMFADLKPNELSFHPVEIFTSAPPEIGMWLERNAGKLASLQHHQVDAMIRSLCEALYKSYQEDARLDATNELSFSRYLCESAKTIRFLSSFFKLHWFVGHGDWAEVLSTIDGSFPRTRPPSYAWTRMLEEDNYRETAAVLGRAWMWPWVFERMCRVDGCFEATPFYIEDTAFPASEGGLWDVLSSLGEWWKDTRDMPVPTVLWRKTVLGEDGKNEALYERALFTWDGPTDVEEYLYCDGDLRSVWEARVEEYRRRLVFPGDALACHERAFPAVGSHLTIADLENLDRLGYVYRDIETELEGEGAWRRLVHNAVFEDFLGPEAIARRLEGIAEELKYRVFGKLSVATRVSTLCDECENLLRTLTKTLLLKLYGDSWAHDGVPLKVRERVADTVRNNSGADLTIEWCSSNTGINEFFEYLFLIDYDKILKAEWNWPVTKELLMSVGFERPTKRSFGLIAELNRIRNRAKHPARSGGLRLDDIANVIEPLKRHLVFWLVALTDYGETEEPDDASYD